MQTKIYQLLYTFSVEHLNYKIIKSCGTFCRIDDPIVSNLMLTIIRPTALCDNLEHLRLTFNTVVYWHELDEVKNECTSYNFRQFAIFVPKNCQIWWKFDVVITKIILLIFNWDTVYIYMYSSAAAAVAIGQLQLQLSHYLVALQAFCFTKCDFWGGLEGASKKNFLGSLSLAIFSGPLINYAIIRPLVITFWTTLYIRTLLKS